MQMAYDDKKIFYNFFLFTIEKFDFLVEMPPESKGGFGIFLQSPHAYDLNITHF